MVVATTARSPRGNPDVAVGCLESGDHGRRGRGARAGRNLERLLSQTKRLATLDNVSTPQAKVPPEPAAAPDIDHPYSVVRRAGRHITVSGRLGVTDSGAIIKGGFDAQCRQAFANLRAALNKAGADTTDVQHVTAYLVRAEDRDTLNQIHHEFFPHPRPTRSCVGVAWLPYGAEVEIEANAILGAPDVAVPWTP